MKKIKLTQGKYAIVDDWNYEWLNRYKWCAYLNGYSWYAMRAIITRQGKHRNIHMHRQILRLSYKDSKQVDHINRDGLDNRRCNIRICSVSQNLQNRKGWGLSQYKGVSWFSPRRKWRARIQVNEKTLYLGYYSDEIEAAKVYNQAATKHFGKNAFVNKI